MHRRPILFVTILVIVFSAACGEPEDFAPATVTQQPSGSDTQPSPTSTATPADERAEPPVATPVNGHASIDLPKPAGTTWATGASMYDWPAVFDWHEIARQKNVVQPLLLSAGDLPDSAAWKLDSDGIVTLQPEEECPGAHMMMPASDNMPVQSVSLVHGSDGARVTQVIDVMRELSWAEAQVTSIGQEFEAAAGCFIISWDGDSSARIVRVERLDLEVFVADASVVYRVGIDGGGVPGTAGHELIVAYARIHHVIVGLQYQVVPEVPEAHFIELMDQLSERIALALDATITRQLIDRIPTPTPTRPPAEPTPSYEYLPEIESCEQAANLVLDRLQLLLDAAADLPEEAVSMNAPPEGLEELSDHIGGEIAHILIQASNAGCRESEVNWWIAEGLDRLTASGPTAELLLAYFVADFTGAYKTVPMPTVTPDWEITTCEGAARVFTERTQVFLDSIVGVTVEQFDRAPQPAPEFLRYAFESSHIVHDFRAIGCSDAEVEALIQPQLDALQAHGELAEMIVEALREGTENGGLFEDL